MYGNNMQTKSRLVFKSAGQTDPHPTQLEGHLGILRNTHRLYCNYSTVTDTLQYTCLSLLPKLFVINMFKIWIWIFVLMHQVGAYPVCLWGISWFWCEFWCVDAWQRQPYDLKALWHVTSTSNWTSSPTKQIIDHRRSPLFLNLTKVVSDDGRIKCV